MENKKSSKVASMSQKLGQSGVLFHGKHAGCSFWESPCGTVFLVQNPNITDLVAQTEVILSLGYKLAGGIQLIRRDDGNFNGCATFTAEE